MGCLNCVDLVRCPEQRIGLGRPKNGIDACKLFSDVLGMCVNMDVIIPQQTKGQIGMEGRAEDGQ